MFISICTLLHKIILVSVKSAQKATHRTSAKQHSAILTATPLKEVLTIKEQKKMQKTVRNLPTIKKKKQ